MNQKDIYDALPAESSLRSLASYVEKMNQIRGFDKDPVEDTMLLLTEEVGELAKAIRKEKGSTVDTSKLYNYRSVEEEAADVLYVLLSVCNTLKIDLYDALLKKEKENIERVWE